jgi:CRISPR-associated endoribonuclease Cas6
VDLGCNISELALSILTVARYKIETRMLDFGRYRQVGFVGEVEFLLKKSGDDITKKIFHLLATFSFYSGVGYKTTMGMGQAKKIER